MDPPWNKGARPFRHVPPHFSTPFVHAYQPHTATMELADFVLGQRVVDEEGNRATVRYLGPVASAKDPTAPQWVGVEWDDPTRGKHDGSVVTADGARVRHFTCVRPGPTSASFLKPAKLDRGVAFMDVLHRRYVRPDAPLEAPNQVFEGAYANTSRGGQKAIEFHGEKKIRARQQIGVLEKVSMRGERVAWAGEEQVAEEAAHLVEVDVQGNLWSDWEELGKLARQMPRLETLHLNSNLMRPLLAPAAGPGLRGAFAALRVLVLNNCGLSAWATVLHVEECVPQLEELGLARNDLAADDMAAAIAARQQRTPEVGHALFHRLRSLDLSGTGLQSWGQVALFQDLPALRLLSLNENAIDAIASAGETKEGEEGKRETYGFATLETLHLSCNRVASWASIDVLRHFPLLHSLRFTSNPLTKGMGQSEARQLVIARVATLTRLNGAEISSRERADAEKSYIRRVARELSRTIASEEEQEKESSSEEKKAALLQRQHPRWLSLVQQHGEATGAGGGGGMGSGGSGTLAKEMLSVKLVSMASASMTLAPTEKKLPGSLTVAQLKQVGKICVWVSYFFLPCSFSPSHPPTFTVVSQVLSIGAGVAGAVLQVGQAGAAHPTRCGRRDLDVLWGDEWVRALHERKGPKSGGTGEGGAAAGRADPFDGAAGAGGAVGPDQARPSGPGEAGGEQRGGGGGWRGRATDVKQKWRKGREKSTHTGEIWVGLGLLCGD